MSRIANTFRILDREAVPVGTVAYLVAVERSKDVAVQWSNFAAAGAATITLYGTQEPDAKRLKTGDVVNTPVANAHWVELDEQFANQPTAAIGSDIAHVTNEPHEYICVLVVTATELTDFSLLVTNKTE